jgi:hypothetical protein
MERCNLGQLVRNPGRNTRFTGNTAFINNVRKHRAEDTIFLAGGHCWISLMMEYMWECVCNTMEHDLAPKGAYGLHLTPH